MKIQGDRVRVGSLGVNGLIQLAYKINGTQLEGPDWLSDSNQTLFDVDAKLPEGATADQAPLMLQTLLAERFKLTIRKGSKQADGYALVVGKSGPKLQQQAPAVSAAAPQPASGEKDEKVPRRLVIGRANITLGPDGTAHVETSTVAGLVDYLTIQFAPSLVVDNTGLQGSFDIEVDLLPVDRSDLPTGGALLPELMDRTLQKWDIGLEKLGLKLERQKVAIDTIIVERAEKTPTEN
jgi:uncharacterized protein (TIGR03435 family)